MVELVECPARFDRAPVPGPVGSPYARLQLRRNPFGELTREDRGALAVVDVAPWIEALRNHRTALQFVGEKGRGKTTHLLAIERSLTAAHYVYLPEDGPQPPIPAVRPLLIDEAQRLSRFNRWRIFRRGGPLVLGTHQDFTIELRRAGLNVINIDVATTCSPTRLACILNMRIEASRLGNAQLPLFSVEQSQQLLARFGSDIRAIENYLYDLFQAAAQKESTWPLVI